MGVKGGANTKEHENDEEMVTWENRNRSMKMAKYFTFLTL